MRTWSETELPVIGANVVGYMRSDQRCSLPFPCAFVPFRVGVFDEDPERFVEGVVGEGLRCEPDDDGVVGGRSGWEVGAGVGREEV